MLLGLRTALYPAPDLAKGKVFYSEVLGVEPYFDEPFYVGFEVGGFELGLVPDATPGADGNCAYWGVKDCAAELARLLSLGATVLEPVTEVGGGIKVAAVADPFGNRLGLIENPHFDLAKVR
jgi:predicted enzyme related to lactoylglutathione lyase